MVGLVFGLGELGEARVRGRDFVVVGDGQVVARVFEVLGGGLGVVALGGEVRVELGGVGVVAMFAGGAGVVVDGHFRHSGPRCAPASAMAGRPRAVRAWARQAG